MANNPKIRPLTPTNRLIIQKFVGLFQYYSRTLDSTMLASISSIATNMTTAAHKDLEFRMNQFLNYAATHPDAKIRFIASEMRLWVHSDASYLTEPKAQSQSRHIFNLPESGQKESKNQCSLHDSIIPLKGIIALVFTL